MCSETSLSAITKANLYWVSLVFSVKTPPLCHFLIWDFALSRESSEKKLSFLTNMCSETSPPRLSFDLIPAQDHHQPRGDMSLLDLNCDFEFSISTCSEQESSSADELFSHGVILPIQPRDRVNLNFPSKQTQNKEIPCLNSLPPLPCSENSKKEKLKEVTVPSSDHLLEQNKPQSTKSFWGNFKRSSSLNCENKRSLLCSLPLLSRSNSTGSVSSQKRATSLKEVNKNNSSQKQPLISMARSSSLSSSSSSISNPYTMMQKPPLKKNYGGSYGNGVRIIPVINVPPPYIPKGTAKLFGFGKDRKSKK